MERIPAEVPFVSPCGCGLSLAHTLLVLLGLDADAGAGRLLPCRPSSPQRELPVWKGAVSTPACASVSVCASVCLPVLCVGCLGLGSSQVCLAGRSAGTVQLCAGRSVPCHLLSELSLEGPEVLALRSCRLPPPWACCLCLGWFGSVGGSEMGLALIILLAPGHPCPPQAGFKQEKQWPVPALGTAGRGLPGGAGALVHS